MNTFIYRGDYHIIKEITPEEARVIKFLFKREEFPDVVDSEKLYGSLDNLLRLKILSYEETSSQSMQETDVERYSSGAKSSFKTSEKIRIDITTTESIQFTSLGCRFIKACVQEKETA